MIRVIRIAQTGSIAKHIDRWVPNAQVSEHYEVSDPERIAVLAGKRCYNVYGGNPNVTKSREDWATYLEHILESGHGSVLEHVWFTYAIEGVSRVFTGELNRHRVGTAISEGSMRYIRFEEMDYWVPPGCGEVEREALREAFAAIQSIYNRTVARFDWNAMTMSEKKVITSRLRRMIPMGIATGGVWSFNLRELRHIMTLRLAPEAEEEIRFVFGLILEDISTVVDVVFRDMNADGTSKYGSV